MTQCTRWLNAHKSPREELAFQALGWLSLLVKLAKNSVCLFVHEPAAATSVLAAAVGGGVDGDWKGGPAGRVICLSSSREPTLLVRPQFPH